MEEDPEIEEELLPGGPDYGAYEIPMEFLHAARLAMDSNLVEPARVLAHEALERTKKAAAAQRQRLDADEEDRARRIGEARTGDAAMDLVDDLAFIAATIEKRIQA